MIEGQFSRTALAAAGFRAAHQIVEGGAVFADPLAISILAGDADLLTHSADPVLRPLRLFVALRSRIAEDAARRAFGEGARQAVTLGAGLDTFGCRAPPGFRVFEVDHPATQAEKRRRLAAVGIAAPQSLRFAPCDFERQSLAQALAEAGFDTDARTAFLWLGVTPYLTRQAFEATLSFIAGLKAGSELTFDYANPPHAIEGAGHRLFHERMAARVAELGESFRGYFETAELHAQLGRLGGHIVADLGPREIAAMFTPGAPPPPAQGGHILNVTFPAA